MKGPCKLLVTGAAGGMGRAVCEELSRQGFQVWGIDLPKALPETAGPGAPKEGRTPSKALDNQPDGAQRAPDPKMAKASEAACASRTETTLQPQAKAPWENRPEGGEKPAIWRYLSADVTDPASLEAARDQIAQEAGSLGAIVHLAGIYRLDSLVEMPEEELRRVFEVNFFGVCRVNRIFLPLLQPASRILITTSELAPLDPLPFTGVYAVSKAALEKYAFSLRMELQLLGHSVVVIRPGAVKTGLLDVSTASLERFCQNTRLYPCNAERFRAIVDKVETKSVPPSAVAKKVLAALRARRPRLVYNLNRNPGLRLLHLLPDRLQTALIARILKT